MLLITLQTVTQIRKEEQKLVKQPRGEEYTFH